MKVMFAAVGSEIISIEALSAVLKKHGHQCTLAFDRGLFDDKQYFSIPFLAKIFDDRKQVIKDILSYKPDILAFSVFTDNFQWCLDVARKVKKVIDIPVIMGGIHPTSAPETCIAEDCVDIICLGEGEYPLFELAESMQNGKIDYTIKNLWFKKNGKIIKNPPRPLIRNLDELPMLDKELFERYIPISSYYLTVTNKGCIARCPYCSQNFYAHWEKENDLGTFYRERSVENVIEELKYMKKKYNYRRVDIKNNILSASKNWTFEFLKKYKEQIALPFRIMGHPKTITFEIAKALKDAGCWHVQIGIESLNPRIRKELLGRYESNEDIYQALQAMDDVGLNYSVDVMVGLPGETDADIIKAIELFSEKKHLIRASIFWLEYFSGVDITNYALKHKYINSDDIDKINKGLQSNYLSTGSVEDRKIKERLFNFQILFRILPIMPGKVIKSILHKGYYKFFKYLPQIPIIIVADILVSVIRKDRWATYAMYSYYWELNRRIKRFFNPKNTRYRAEMEQDLIKEINRIFYEVEAEDYDLRHPEIMEGDREWWDNAGGKYIKSMSEEKNISILDVGSGTGFVGDLLIKYLNKGDSFICYDLSPNMLAKASEKLMNKYPEATYRFLKGDAETLPFEDTSLDVITINAVLHHLPNYPSLLKEIDRVLKREGLLIVAHEHNLGFFKSKLFSFLATLYKLVGGRMKITDSICKKVNVRLKERGLIKANLTKEEVMKLVDFHSPIEQNEIFIDRQKGFLPQDILKTYFSNYELLELREYSTFFHRPFLEKNKIFLCLLKLLNSIILRNRGPLFSFIVRKCVVTLIFLSLFAIAQYNALNQLY